MEICAAISFPNFAVDLRLIRYGSLLLRLRRKKKKKEKEVIKEGTEEGDIYVERKRKRIPRDS